jgi:hypothetical protein
MSPSKIAELCERLTQEKRDEVADSARFLLSRQQDENWEAIIAETRTRPRLDAFLRESAAEGDEPLELGRRIAALDELYLIADARVQARAAPLKPLKRDEIYTDSLDQSLTQE